MTINDCLDSFHIFLRIYKTIIMDIFYSKVLQLFPVFIIIITQFGISFTIQCFSIRSIWSHENQFLLSNNSHLWEFLRKNRNELKKNEKKIFSVAHLRDPLHLEAFESQINKGFFEGFLNYYYFFKRSMYFDRNRIKKHLQNAF